LQEDVYCCHVLGHAGDDGKAKGCLMSDAAPPWLSEIIKTLARLESGLTRVQAGLTGVEANQASMQTQLKGMRTELLERMDRLQGRLDNMDDHLTLAFGHTDRVEKKGQSVADDNRILGEMQMTLGRIVRRLEGRMNGMEERE
jgi:hypothetical protein